MKSCCSLDPDFTKAVLFIVVIILLGAIILLMGCVEEDTTFPPDDVKQVSRIDARIGMGSQITKYYDAEEHVVCYVYSDYERGGISCIQTV